MNDKKIIRNNQHRSMKRKSCWTNLVTFYSEMTGLVDEGRAVNTVCLGFSRVFDTVSRKILLDKLLVYRLDEQTARWIENWLNGQAQWVVISGTTSSWMPVMSSVPQGSILALSTPSLMVWMSQSTPS